MEGKETWKMDDVAKELQEKGFKGFASMAQVKRCDSLVADGTIVKDVFERDLLATEIEGLSWRKGPTKPSDGTEEEQAEYREQIAKRREYLMEQYNHNPESRPAAAPAT